MGVKFFKLRAFLAIFLVKIFSKIMVVEFPPIFSVTALIENKGKLLFMDYSYLKGLGFPGGIVKSGDNMEESLEREVLEETGMKVVKAKYLGSVKSSLRGIAIVSGVYRVEVKGEMRSSEEGSLLWLDPKEALGKMAYEDSAIVLKRWVEEPEWMGGK